MIRDEADPWSPHFANHRINQCPAKHYKMTPEVSIPFVGVTRTNYSKKEKHTPNPTNSQPSPLWKLILQS